jgi:hypothetical protein
MKPLVLLLAGIAIASAESPWIPLFNGKDLSGWTPKIRHHPLGENHANTFSVEDGILKASYADYGKFDNQFGHLYTNIAYSRYILRMEYRFVGKKMADAPGYVNLNSGVMIHSQSPQSMTLDQAFPVSIEFQFLADEGKGPRSTANICTPGTNIEMGGKLITEVSRRSILENPSDTLEKRPFRRVILHRVCRHLADHGQMMAPSASCSMA